MATVWKNLTSLDPRKPAAVEALRSALRAAALSVGARERVTLVKVSKDGSRVCGYFSRMGLVVEATAEPGTAWRAGSSGSSLSS